MISEFGHLPDGRQVDEIRLKKGRLEASILTLGAIVKDLKVDGRSVVLGFETLMPYLEEAPYMGAVVGRCANRIADGRLRVDGEDIQLEKNENQQHHLHGGSKGFSTQIWSLEKSDKASVLLKRVSPDGDMGYPGNVEVLLRYTLTGTGALRMKVTASTDKTTPINLAQHCYFNLDGSETILDHHLEIAAEDYLPTNDAQIPTGEIRKVAWTPYDFQDGKQLKRKANEKDVIYDHNFCLSTKQRDQVAFAAALEDKSGDCRMEVWTTEPGLQLYDAGNLSCKTPGTTGQLYGPYAGLCLEAQAWPNAVNEPSFPNVLVTPEETYTQITEFRFA